MSALCTYRWVAGLVDGHGDPIPDTACVAYMQATCKTLHAVDISDYTAGSTTRKIARLKWLSKAAGHLAPGMQPEMASGGPQQPVEACAMTLPAHDMFSPHKPPKPAVSPLTPRPVLCQVRTIVTVHRCQMLIDCCKLLEWSSAQKSCLQDGQPA